MKVIYTAVKQPPFGAAYFSEPSEGTKHYWQEKKNRVIETYLHLLFSINNVVTQGQGCAV